MDSPRGRIYQMNQVSRGEAPLSDSYRMHIDLCLACRGCESACPSGVQYGKLVEAARSLGADHWGIIRRHISPNLLTEIIILVNLEIGRIILVESSLSYLGLGVQPPWPTWGNMLNEGRQYLQTAWWVVTFPGAAIMLTVLGVNLFAEGLRAIYDPRSRR